MESKQRDKRIEDIRKKKPGARTETDKYELNLALKDRAKENAVKPRDLNELLPSQMTQEEMIGYCETNKIKTEKEETPYSLRKKIRAFRDPSAAQRDADMAKIRI